MKTTMRFESGDVTVSTEGGDGRQVCLTVHDDSEAASAIWLHISEIMLLARALEVAIQALPWGMSQALKQQPPGRIEKA